MCNVRTAPWLLVALIAGVAGCAPPATREQLAKEVVAQDPDFAAVIQKHKDIASRIQTYDRELALKRSTVENAIQQLRADLAGATTGIKLKINETKKRMEPDRQRLETALARASQELKTKRSQRAALGREISQYRKSVSSARTGPTPEDRRRHEERLEEMLRDAKRFDMELASLKEHVRLLKIKLLLIKL
jgi:hypothetical protein